jgi:thiol-disulfide isomerase/thioredoxin
MLIDARALRIPAGRRIRLAAVGVTALLALAATGCGGDESAQTVPTTDVTPPASASLPDSAGTAAPISLETIKKNLPLDFDVGVYQREDILGGMDLMFSEIVALGRPVVLNAWAGLCPPCRAEMPELQAVFEEFEDHVILLGLDLGPFTGLGNEGDARDLIAEIGVTYPAGNTDNSRVVTSYRIFGMPSTIFIKPDGDVMRTWTGAIDESTLRRLIAELIVAS